MRLLLVNTFEGIGMHLETNLETVVLCVVLLAHERHLIVRQLLLQVLGGRTSDEVL